MNENYDDLLIKYALNSKNYKGWRSEHGKMFGDLFNKAFSENEEAQIHLTAALINISKRDFRAAEPKLKMLETVAITEYDRAVVDYFSGLNYEMLDNESEMNEHYRRLLASEIRFVYPLPFHPFYRIAKFAQRDSECSKSLHYYKKALEFYDGRTPTEQEKSTVGQIIYEVATVCLYMHNYAECEKFLALSEQYDPSENSQRTYVKSLLCAVTNRINEAYYLAETLNRFFREYLDPMLAAVSEGKDLHYCNVAQDRTDYEGFHRFIFENKEKIIDMLNRGLVAEAEEMISSRITDALKFMNRKLAVRIEERDGKVSFLCKNYCVISLIGEHDVLFSENYGFNHGIKFTSVNWFEDYK